MLNSATKNLLLAGASTAMLIAAPVAGHATTTINVAVASNFYGATTNYPTTSPIASVINAFVALYASSGTAYSVVVTQNGASGTLYNSITGGNTPNVDVVFFADNIRAASLASTTNASTLVTGLPFDYAVGTLVLWSVNTDVSNGFDPSQFTGPGSLAIATPANAPYGLAAQAFLQNNGAFGANNTATYSNVDATYVAIAGGKTVKGGFVALSQICAGGTWPSPSAGGTAFAINAVDLSNPSAALYNYPVIIQSAIRVNRQPTAFTTQAPEYLEREAFINFIRDRSSPTAPIVPILTSFCYGIPS